MGRKKGQPRHELIWLYGVQRGICAGCGAPVPAFGDLCLDPDRASQDHFVPRVLGGSDGLANKLMMHVRCNGAKGDRMPNGCERIWHELVLAELYVRPPVFPSTPTNPAMRLALTAALGASNV